MLPAAFKKAEIILEKIEANGHEAYFVGGCVRDLFLKRKVKDIDIASSASPEEIEHIFDKVIPVGIEHGTVIVRHEQVSYEVTTFRHEGTYSDQRHPDEVSFLNSIEEDLQRRDFTMNALAMNRHGKIIDLYNGISDLNNKIIRSVGHAADRFQEDPLRIIRALRFSSQLGFIIEANTLMQMKKLNQEVATVAVERLTNEFTKLFQGESIQNGISYLMETEIDKYIPIFHKNRAFFTELPQPLTSFYSFAEVIAFFHYRDQSISLLDWIKGWKCSNEMKNEAINLYDALLYYERSGIDEWLIYRLERNFFQSFIHLIQLLFQNVDTSLHTLLKMKDQLAIQSRQDLNINGHEIMEMYPANRRGPWIRITLEKIEREVVFKRLENKNTVIKEWIRCHPPAIN